MRFVSSSSSSSTTIYFSSDKGFIIIMVQSCVSDPFSFSHKIISVSFFLTDVQKCNIAVNFTFSFVNQFLQPFEYSRYHTDIPSLPLSSSLPLPSVLSKQCTFDSKISDHRYLASFRSQSHTVFFLQTFCRAAISQIVGYVYCPNSKTRKQVKILIDTSPI